MPKRRKTNKKRATRKKAPRKLKTFTSRHFAVKHAKKSKSTKRFKVLSLGKNKFAVVREGTAFF